ncbi:cysteine proteinase [Rozella allomycis CSF55]|uniref:Ubiquitin carboxyl-terminal hydrolase n=1 Tax=Rozella allomycis (strain CSF55) TaxID=988480 RepID=A0A075ATD1_ROZAC|nr:Peptidase C12, ubiquitin carboxyl-terminal hydrolase 1 domain-containing protein [Rozella allomycis CSF55]RKP22017.1 cysteine proteinase [Rozella allomycis CSF55]|eukprot:EPZ31980.1 Peptidase C12, ubiquitin carboxyl-terminal hydrolase 1 domain-containing protein [Rozella allomycis CSF55]
MSIRWRPLESDPEIMNKYLAALKVQENSSFQDIFCLDNDVLELYSQFMTNEECKMNNIFFMKQTIENACGSIAILHALMNNENLINNSETLQKFKKSVDDLNFHDRGEQFGNTREFADLHNNLSIQGSSIDHLNEDVYLHFVCFVQKNNHLFELDGRLPGPIDHGPCKNLLKDTSKQVKMMISENPGEVEFSLIVLCNKES